MTCRTQYAMLSRPRGKLHGKVQCGTLCSSGHGPSLPSVHSGFTSNGGLSPAAASSACASDSVQPSLMSTCRQDPRLSGQGATRKLRQQLKPWAYSLACWMQVPEDGPTNTSARLAPSPSVHSITTQQQQACTTAHAPAWATSRVLCGSRWPPHAASGACSRAAGAAAGPRAPGAATASSRGCARCGFPPGCQSPSLPGEPVCTPVGSVPKLWSTECGWEMQWERDRVRVQSGRDPGRGIDAVLLVPAQGCRTNRRVHGTFKAVTQNPTTMPRLQL